MRRVLLTLVAFALLLAAAPPSNQAISYSTLVANQSGNFTWATAAPTGSTQLVTAARYRALVVTTSCPQATATGSQIVDWQFVISCAASRSVSPQSQNVTGNYSTVYYTSTYNSLGGFYTCFGPFGGDAYTGTPITLPAGTAAPTTSATQLSLNFTTISFSGSTSITVKLKNPSGTVVFTSPTITASSYSTTYYATGAPAGAWSWVITQSGGTDGTCNPTTGRSGGGTQVSWSGSIGWYQ